ncbi:Abscisic acid 8'-hydroxylase 4 isoform 2 [Theobroma cacao]|uniref:Abscisic acid 8'-hydroxylase 4 isoform 2 n=1 Tax=Theobroma cacao TaxID=3641 RepID=A0A061DZR5_THECC|nr:Abscisic acid 8'-hydroxylase 4 isoform 2 [Theobroma cacao]
METVSILLYVILFLSTLLSYPFLRKQKRGLIPMNRFKLPPGSMGWPYVGETLQLYSQDPNIFFSTKQKRYGEIFKTHILGCPCVMLASPEAARFVLVTHARLFKPTYPKSKEKMIGPYALFFHQGEYHTRLRKLVQSSLAPDTIRKLIPGIEDIAVSALESWAGSGQVINTFYEMKKTAYHKALLARKRLNQILGEIICERKEKGLVEKDLLGHLLNFKDEKGQTLTEDKIADNIIGVLFAAQDTTASVITWILKFLRDDPRLLEAVKAEQKAIYDSNDGGKRPLTWAQTRSMPLTYRVVLESLRMASIISFTFREAVVDVEYKGYLIPKGWKVMPLFRNIHHNPEFFSDPHDFDPSRFEVAPKPNTFMPFGNGVHACPGNELAKLEALILIHHLVTKFRWEVVGSQSGIQYGPFPVPQQGLPTRFWKDSSRDVCPLVTDLGKNSSSIAATKLFCS